VSRARFGLLLALLVLVVGAGAFAGVLAQLDDDDPSGGSAAATTSSSDTTTTTALPTGLTTPTFVTVVSSEREEAGARALADELTEQGFDSAVLRSDDHTSLEPGFWVAYVGPFPEAGPAQAAVSDLAANGYTASYVRCVGTADECG